MTNEFASNPDFSLSSEVEADAALITVGGEVDASTADQLRSALVKALADHKVIVIDLAGVTFMDSSGLSVLTHALNEVGERDGTLTLRSPSSPVRRLLEITGLVDRFL